MPSKTLAIKFTSEGFSQTIQSVKQVGFAFDEALGKAQESVKNAIAASKDAANSGDLSGFEEAEKAQVQAAKKVQQAVNNAYRELRIKSSADIEQLKFQSISAFEALKKSGVASAIDIKNAEIALTKRLADLDRQLGETGGGFRNFGTQANFARSVLSNFLGDLASTAVSSFLSSLINAANGLKDAVFRAGITTENLKAQLKTLEGSSAAADNAYAKIAKFAKETPFELDQVTQAYVSLANRGIKPAETELRKIGDLAASQQKPLQQYVEAILDAMTGENERLKEFGIKATQSGDKVSFTFKGITKTVEKSEEAIYKALLSFSELNGVLGGMNERAKTTEGQLSNLNDALQQIYVKLFQAIKPALDSLTKSAIAILEPLGQQPKLFEEINLQAKAFQKLLETNPQLVKEVSAQFESGLRVAVQGVASTAKTLLEYLQQNPTAIQDTVENLGLLINAMGEFVKLINTALSGWKAIVDLVKITSQELSINKDISPAQVGERIKAAGGNENDVNRVLAEIKTQVDQGSIGDRLFNVPRTQQIVRAALDRELSRLGGQGAINEGSDQGLRNLSRQQQTKNDRSNAYAPLLDLIAGGEGGVSSANRGRAGDTPGGLKAIIGKNAEQTTIREILAAQAKGQLFAVGTYQFIPSTLKSLVKQSQISLDSYFTKAVQDRLAILILENKRPQVGKFLSGKNTNINEAAQELAREFASIGLAYPEAGRKVGESRYSGLAGNAASISPSQVKSALNLVREQLGSQSVVESRSSSATVDSDQKKKEAEKILEDARKRQDQSAKIQQEQARTALEDKQKRELLTFDLSTAKLPQAQKVSREAERTTLVRDQQFALEYLRIEQTINQLQSERTRKLEDIKSGQTTDGRNISQEIEILQQRKKFLSETVGIESEITKQQEAQRIAEEARQRSAERTRQAQDLDRQKLEETQEQKLLQFDAATTQLPEGGAKESRAIQRDALERQLFIEKQSLEINQAIANLQEERSQKLSGKFTTGRDITAEIQFMEERKKLLTETARLQEQIATAGTTQAIAQKKEESLKQLTEVNRLLIEIQSEQTSRIDDETKAVDAVESKYSQYRLTIDEAVQSLTSLIDFKQSLGLVTDEEIKSLEQLKSKYQELFTLQKTETINVLDQVSLGARQKELDNQNAIANIDAQIAQGQASKLQAQGDTFGANAILKKDAINQENLRYQQQLLDLESNYSGNPQLLDEMAQKAKTLKDLNLDQINSQFKGLGETVAELSANGVTQFFDDITKGSKSAGEAFRDMSKGILIEIGKMLVKFLVLKAVGLISGAFGGGTSAIAIPTIGRGAAFAEGGLVRGPGSGTSDSIPARLSNGEFVIKAQAVKNWGETFLNSINSVRTIGQGVAFAEGGLVRGPGSGTSDSIAARLSNGEFVIKAQAVKNWGENFLNGINSSSPDLQFSLSNIGRQESQNAGGARTVNVTQTIVTPNADSFRKSDYQISKEMAESARRAMMRT